MARSWTYFGIGFWLIISPWLLAFSEITLAKWSNVLIGLALVIISAWELFGKPSDGKGRSMS